MTFQGSVHKLWRSLEFGWWRWWWSTCKWPWRPGVGWHRKQVSVEKFIRVEDDWLEHCKSHSHIIHSLRGEPKCPYLMVELPNIIECLQYVTWWIVCHRALVIVLLLATRLSGQDSIIYRSLWHTFYPHSLKLGCFASPGCVEFTIRSLTISTTILTLMSRTGCVKVLLVSNSIVPIFEKKLKLTLICRITFCLKPNLELY